MPQMMIIINCLSKIQRLTSIDTEKVAHDFWHLSFTEFHNSRIAANLSVLRRSGLEILLSNRICLRIA